MKNNKNNHHPSDPSEQRARKKTIFLRILLLSCLAAGALGIAFSTGLLTMGGAAFQKAAKQKGARRTGAPAPKPPTTRPSKDSQIVSESQQNDDGTITPGKIITDDPIVRTGADIMAEQDTRPAQPSTVRLLPEREGPEREDLPQNPTAVEGTQWPIPKQTAPNAEPGAPQTPSTSFDGATGPSETGAFPPDTMGAVGPTQFVVFLNGRLRTFNKTTGVADGVINADSDVFFSSVITPPLVGEVSFTSDPQVRFDRNANRWFLVIIDVTLNPTTGATTRANRILIALSDAASNGAITAGTVWTFYQFQGDATLFTDYESLGVDANALYIGGNMFTLAGTFNSTKGFIIPKAPLLTGSPATVWTASNLATGAAAGPFAPRGVDNDDPANTGITATGYFIGVDTLTFSTLMLRRVTNPGSLGPAPTISANLSVSTTISTQNPVLVPHLGNTGGNNGRLDSLDDRLYAAHQRNGRLWTAHNIGVNNTGTTTGTRTRNAARWYELQNLGTTPTVLQAGTLFDNSGANDVNQRNYWIPSITVSGQGHAALGCTIAGTNERINAFTTGRLSSDTLGTLRNGPGGGTLPGYTASSTVYNPASDAGGSGGRRWGDYSFTSLDPRDDMTIWTVQEYSNGTNTYGARVVKLLAPPPATPASSAPAAVAAGQASVNVVITGTSVNGSGFFDPGANLAAPALPFIHIGASVTGVTVNSVIYTDPTHITLNLSTLGATAGAKNVTVTNPDGQTATGTNILTVTGGCPAISATPATLTQGTVGTAYNQSLTGAGGTGPYTFALTAGSSLPNGLSLATNGAITGTPMAAGSFMFTVSVTDANTCPGSAAISLNIVCPAVSVTPTTLTQGTVGTAYNQSVGGSGGTGPYSFVLAAGSSLPSGLSLATNGAITGTPMAAGTVSFTVTATDSKGCSGSTLISLSIVCPTISATPSTLPGGIVGTAYSQSLSGNGGTGPYTFTLAAGSNLPNGLSLATNGAMTGTPMAAGAFTFTVTATDSKSCSGNTLISLNITCPTISAIPATLPGGTVGTAYSQSLTGAGGTGPYTFVLAVGSSLPNGLSLATNGAITGTPMAAGSFSFTITATDSKGCSGSTLISLTIICPTISVTPATLTQGTVGTAYNQSVGGSGGAGPYTFVLAAGSSLPNGLSLATNGAITGTPMAAGSFSFMITATDSKGCFGSTLISLAIVCPTISPAPAILPQGTVSFAYNQSLTGTGGTGPYTFELMSGSALPGGLSLATNGAITGTPTTMGMFSFTVVATDSKNCPGSALISLTINAAPCPTITLNPPTVPGGTVGAAYTPTSITASGGTGPYGFAITNGTLPTGLSLTSGGSLSGTPMAAGSFTFTVTATDTNNCTGAQQYTVIVTCPVITVMPATLPQGIVSAAYNQSVSGSGGTGPYTFVLAAGSLLPSGLSLATNGAITGTAMGAGSFSFTITATDSKGCSGSTLISLTIVCPTIAVTPATLPAGTAGVVYSQGLSGSGGTGPYTFTQAGGALPPGLTLNSDGTVTGTPTQTGAFNFTAKATDSKGCMGTQNIALAINCPAITVNPAPAGGILPAGTTGAAYSQMFSASGAVGSVTFSLNSGGLPAGLTLSGNAISGMPTAAGSATFEIKATDSNGCTGLRMYTINTNCPAISITPGSLVAGTAGQVYPAAALAAIGGTLPYTFSLMSGSVPNGMSLSLAGVISGTPAQSGTFSFTVKATDANGCMGTQAYTLTITCLPITVNPAGLPPGLVSQVYNQTISASGGNGPDTFNVTAGALPGGVTLSSAGALTGTPTTSGSFTFTVTATDANGCTGARQYTLLICAVITVNPAALPNGFVGTAYNAALTATGGIAPYSFTLIAGALPGGISLPSGGGLAGTPAAPGTFTFTVQATDASGCTGTRQYVVIISGAGLMFYPLATPVRLLDTRAGQTGCDAPGAPIAAGTERLQLARRTCGGITIPNNALAITGNITPVQSGGGFLTLFPSNAARPVVASSNYSPNQAVNNVFTVGLGTDGAFKIFALNTTDVVVDVTGYYAPPGTGGLFFHPLPKPIRLLETRAGQSGCDTPGAQIGGGTTRMQQGRVTCDGVTIPAAALAIVGNATPVLPSAPGFLTIFPGNAAQPLVSNGNYNGGDAVNTPFTVGLAPDGIFKIFTTATTNLVVDVSGYYSTDVVDVNGAGLLLNPLAHPVRLLETRLGQSGCFAPGAPITGGVDFTQPARATCEALTIPAAALGIVGNATVVEPPGPGFLTLWPSNVTRPTVSALNYNTAGVVNRHFTVGLGTDGAFKVFSPLTTHLVIDLSGYFAP